MHVRSLILIGATNNTWSDAALWSRCGTASSRVPLAKIQDAKNPDSTEWQIDFTQPYAQVAVDYAIVARYRDSTTEGPVMVVAEMGHLRHGGCERVCVDAAVPGADCEAVARG